MVAKPYGATFLMFGICAQHSAYGRLNEAALDFRLHPRLNWFR